MLQIQFEWDFMEAWSVPSDLEWTLSELHFIHDKRLHFIWKLQCFSDLYKLLVWWATIKNTTERFGEIDYGKHRASLNTAHLSPNSHLQKFDSEIFLWSQTSITESNSYVLKVQLTIQNEHSLQNRRTWPPVISLKLV